MEKNGSDSGLSCLQAHACPIACVCVCVCEGEAAQHVEWSFCSGPAVAFLHSAVLQMEVKRPA